MKITLRLLSLVLFSVLTFSVFVPTVVFAAEGESISDLSLANGADGVQALEESGYTVMGRPLTGDVWLGYKKGGTPVTGLIVSPAESDTLTADGIIYQRAGSIGSAGSLFITREPGAGDPVLSLTLQSDEGLADQPLYSLKNDGSSPLRRENGKPCNLGDGQTAYLFILRENVFRPYISGVTAVSGDDLRAAITAAATAGCNYYYDPGLETENGRPVVLGYTRTAYETDAITCIAAGTDTPVVEGVIFESAGEISIEAESPYRLYQTHDRSAGNPIVALTGSAVPVRSSDIMNKWAEKTFVKFNTSAASVNLVKSETMYQSFLKDESPLTHVGVHDVSAGGVITPLAYTCKAAGLPMINFDSNAVKRIYRPMTSLKTTLMTISEPIPISLPMQFRTTAFIRKVIWKTRRRRLRTTTSPTM